MDVLILSNVLFYLSLSIMLFDLDYRRAKKFDESFKNDPDLPWWAGLIYWVCIISWIVILFMSWKLAILGVVIYFASSFVPLPQIIGNILMSPFKPKVKKIIAK